MPPPAETELASLVRAYPDVQLATLTEAAPDGAGWVHEVKFDGYRLLGFLAAGQVALRTRNGNDWTAKFPTIAAALRSFRVADAVVDMEAVVLDDSGKSTFKGLQEALSPGGERAAIVAFGFDLLHLQGESCTALPLLKRKQKLKTLLKRANSTIRYSTHVTGSGAQLVGKACAMGLEGIVSKRSTSPYAGGRQHSWLKTKCIRRQEFIILGYSAPRSGTRALGALYLGYKSGKKLCFAGKCGTGFTMASARTLVAQLRPVNAPVINSKDAQDVPLPEWRAIHWVEPNTLCEVAFTEWAGEGRIRHPSFQGLRTDKAANEVVREEPWQKKPRSK